MTQNYRQEQSDFQNRERTRREWESTNDSSISYGGGRKTTLKKQRETNKKRYLNVDMDFMKNRIDRAKVALDNHKEYIQEVGCPRKLIILI